MSNVFITNIEKDTLDNKYYREVIYTSGHQQLVLMNIKPNEDIEFEVHHSIDQFIRIEKGHGLLVIGPVPERAGQPLRGHGPHKEYQYHIYSGIAFIIPAGTYHQIFNISKKEHLKLYTLYSPPSHKQGHIDVFRPGPQSIN